MSQDEALSRKKTKKANRDAERQKTGKKRKREEVEVKEEAKPTNGIEKDFIPLETRAAAREVKNGNVVPSQSSSRKRKKRKTDLEQPPLKSQSQLAEDETTAAPETKPKKRRKIKHENIENGDEAKAVETADKAKSRFILFIGNLPYSTTDAALQSHFKKLAPFTLRHRTDPKTKKSKGFAFLEFENYDRMKTCLKLYHHTMFDPAKTGANVEADGDTATNGSEKKSKGARRINVELTAGGGGKTEGRREKIKAKNVRLDEQRKRRAEQEMKDKEKKEKKEKKSKDGKGETSKMKASDVVEAGGEEDRGNIHPSRLARVER